NVGMTLLRIDRGVDTGPVFGHFRITADPSESHVAVEHRAVLEHLEGVKRVLQDVAAGRARPLDTTGRPSAASGPPGLSAHIRMCSRAGRAARQSIARAEAGWLTEK